MQAALSFFIWSVTCPYTSRGQKTRWLGMLAFFKQALEAEHLKSRRSLLPENGNHPIVLEMDKK